MAENDNHAFQVTPKPLRSWASVLRDYYQRASLGRLPRGLTPEQAAYADWSNGLITDAEGPGQPFTVDPQTGGFQYKDYADTFIRPAPNGHQLTIPAGYSADFGLPPAPTATPPAPKPFGTPDFDPFRDKEQPNDAAVRARADFLKRLFG